MDWGQAKRRQIVVPPRVVSESLGRDVGSEAAPALKAILARYVELGGRPTPEAFSEALASVVSEHWTEILGVQAEAYVPPTRVPPKPVTEVMGVSMDDLARLMG